MAALAALFGLSGATSAAEPFASDWALSLKSQARLIADGVEWAGFQVELAPGSITYWRDPGEAGAPPTFDFSGSTNLASAEVEFPAPKRIAESDGTDAFGYEGAVVFPIRVRAVDPARPVTLLLNANYAVCEKICLPARAVLKLELAAGAASPYAATLAAARVEVPKPTDARALGLEVAALDAKSWRICFAGAADKSDLFAEPPPGWWVTVRKEEATPGRACFKLMQQEAPKDAAGPIEARLTITGADPAAETTVRLGAK